MVELFALFYTLCMLHFRESDLLTLLPTNQSLLLDCMRLRDKGVSGRSKTASWHGSLLVVKVKQHVVRRLQGGNAGRGQYEAKELTVLEECITRTKLIQDYTSFWFTSQEVRFAPLVYLAIVLASLLRKSRW